MSRSIPIDFLIEPAVYSTTQAAAYHGVSRSMIWKWAGLTKTNPLHLKRVCQGKYAKAELDRHIRATMERAA
jgi:hypothetical protein